jgi:WD40 repeat protein
MVVSNLKDGLDFYSLRPEHGKLTTQIRYAIHESQNVELQCCFTNGGKWVVVGGADGYIRVFERISGQILTTVQGSDTALVQTVTVSRRYPRIVLGSPGSQSYDGPNNGLIVAAGTQPNSASTIQVWTYLPHQAAAV